MTERTEASGYQPIEHLELFRRLEVLCDDVWADVAKWPAFARDTVGKQLVAALDSVGANLAEGDGRFSDRESLHFFSISKGSAREARYWLHRARVRSLIPAERVSSYLDRLESCMRMLSGLAATRRRWLQTARESPVGYAAEPADDAAACSPSEPNDLTT